MIFAMPHKFSVRSHEPDNNVTFMQCPQVADHIYFTDRGVIVEHGPPATFFKEAKDPRTKEFLSQIL